MDIDILLWIQSLREGSAPAIQAFFSFLGSEAAMAVAMVVPVFIYWCLDKACGHFAFLAYGASSVFNQLIKNTACIYRPWVRDARITPDPTSLKGAGGYSFPSGHTQSVTSMTVALGWERRERVWPMVVAFVFSVLVGFSRLYLGVHAPQDVVVGLVEGFLFVILADKVAPWMEREGNDVRSVVAGVALTVLYLIYVTVKPYDVTYVNGELLVDPQEMLIDCYKAGGAFLGIIIGWFVERRYVKFETGGLSPLEIVARLVVGGALTFVVYKLLGSACLVVFGERYGQLLKHVAAFFTGIAGAPMLFSPLHSLLSGRKDQ